MTAAKDMSRPASQQRPSVSSGSPNVSIRSPYGRAHSHTSSLGSVHAAHRISRRKSSTFSPVPRPAVIEAAVENAVAEGTAALNRRTSASKAALAALNDARYSHLPASLPQQASVPDKVGMTGTALVDGPSLSSFQGVDKAKPKVRRASDGTHLSKKEKVAASIVKCEHCGKAYKHGSCLSKHLWEHTPQWQYTSKLLISKHQQVQLLEAASVLVAMNQDAPTSQDSDSSSPAASGSSDMRDDDVSSTETTPPPLSEATYRDGAGNKRYSANSSAYSRSYQSVFSAGSVPNSEHGFSHHRQWSQSSTGRPLTANTVFSDHYRDEDPQDLAAAVGLLSCSYGTPKTGPTTMPMDVPPVPPLPEKYQNQSSYRAAHIHHHHQPSQDQDIEMDDDDDDEDDGMFGKMDA